MKKPPGDWRLLSLVDALGQGNAHQVVIDDLSSISQANDHSAVQRMTPLVFQECLRGSECNRVLPFQRIQFTLQGYARAISRLIFANGSLDIFDAGILVIIPGLDRPVDDQLVT